MTTALTAIADRLRQPEYTGANRCVPCTVLNGFIALAVVTLVGIVMSVFGIPVAVFSVAAALLMASGAIYSGGTSSSGRGGS